MVEFFTGLFFGLVIACILFIVLDILKGLPFLSSTYSLIERLHELEKRVALMKEKLNSKM